MTKRQFRIRLLVLLGLVCSVTIISNGQSKSISLEEALNITRKNNAGLERDKLAIDQLNKLSETGVPLQPTQLYLSGEEFGANDQTGIHSINIMQNFNLPKVSKVQKTYYRQGATVAERQLNLTDHELKRQVKLAYYHLVYAKQNQILVAENLALFEDFLTVTTTQLESGETGKIPQLAARSHLGQARLALEEAAHKYQVSLSMFNLWLNSDILYDVDAELTAITNVTADVKYDNNPHLKVIQAQRELAKADIEVQKAQLLPQLNTGFKLQTQAGNFPLFGYQLGVNVPLFKKAYKGRIEAAEVGVKVQEADLLAKEQELARKILDLQQRLANQLVILEYLREDLTPVVNEQLEMNLTAYREGEVSYLEYMDGLEQVIKVKHQYLTALYKSHTLSVELDYWLGQ